MSSLRKTVSYAKKTETPLKESNETSMFDTARSPRLGIIPELDSKQVSCKVSELTSPSIEKESQNNASFHQNQKDEHIHVTPEDRSEVTDIKDHIEDKHDDAVF